MSMYRVFARLLEEKGVTAYAVAKATGIPCSTFSEWKHGKSAPKIDKIQKIAAFFGVSLDDFVRGDGNGM